MSQVFKITSQMDSRSDLSRIARNCESGCVFVMYAPGEKVKQRTLPQNNSIYLYFTNVSKAMNDSGVTQHSVYLGRYDKTLEVIHSELIESDGYPVKIIDGEEYIKASWVHSAFTKLQEALPRFETLWSSHSVKELWRKFQKAHLGTESTTDLKTGDIEKVYDPMTKTLGGLGVPYVPFPSQEELVDQKLSEQRGVN